MWQGDLADQLEWSASKTSRTLSEMENDGQVVRYQIGRQNVVCLPHRVPDHLDARAGNYESSEP